MLFGFEHLTLKYSSDVFSCVAYCFTFRCGVCVGGGAIPLLPHVCVLMYCGCVSSCV